MNARKNIRQALGKCGYASPNFEASQAAGWYAENEDSDVDSVLMQLSLLDVARAALREGLPLEIVGARGPYGTPAQQRAWAAGQLAAACRAIDLARRLTADRQAAERREGELRAMAERLRAEARAAWKQVKIDVPFREPKPNGRVDWLMESSGEAAIKTLNNSARHRCFLLE